MPLSEMPVIIIISTYDIKYANTLKTFAKVNDRICADALIFHEHQC